MDSIYNLQQRADALRRKNLVESISPEEVGGLHADTLAYMADMEQNIKGLGIHKVYKSVAEMNADSSSPVGTNGKPLRFGQLVTIYDNDNLTQTENGYIYAFQKGSWLMVSKIDQLEFSMCKLDYEDIDFGLSPENKSAENWRIYKEVPVGMFVLVDNSSSDKGICLGILLQYKDNMSHALNQVVISSSPLQNDEYGFKSHKDGYAFIRYRSWRTLMAPSYAGAKNTWSDWHDANEIITAEDIAELF